eukprot:jgi/Ulvmu1/12576/UM092_0006.1
MGGVLRAALDRCAHPGSPRPAAESWAKRAAAMTRPCTESRRAGDRSEAHAAHAAPGFTACVRSVCAQGPGWPHTGMHAPQALAIQPSDRLRCDTKAVLAQPSPHLDPPLSSPRLHSEAVVARSRQ